MTDADRDVEPFSSAKKTGTNLRFSRDPDPETSSYLVLEADGLLVLFPERNDSAGPVPSVSSPMSTPDSDAQLRDAFKALSGRVPDSLWSRSTQPQTDLNAGFRELNDQPDVREDVATYLARNSSVANAAQMLFTSLAMSARADWRAVPEPHRGVAARGWFLRRWIPTFLVLDGPILRFLKSTAFRRQKGSGEFLRAVRSVFEARDFIALRHAFAHWSFSWIVSGADSEIVAVAHDSTETRMSRKEIDALHILTFAVVDALHRAFLQSR